MRKILPLLSLAILSACAEEPSPEEQAVEAATRNALVEKGNATLPPLELVEPQPIQYPDIERHDLFGAGCNFAPGTSVGTRVIARPVDAYMKIDGEMVRFAADSGARELPLGTRSRYLGRAHELQLELSGEGTQSGSETVDYQGIVTLRDEHGRIVYRASGLAQCGS